MSFAPRSHLFRHRERAPENSLSGHQAVGNVTSARHSTYRLFLLTILAKGGFGLLQIAVAAAIYVGLQIRSLLWFKALSRQSLPKTPAISLLAAC